MAKNATSDPFVTPVCRIGFPSVDKPWAGPNGDSTPKYQAHLLFAKDSDLGPFKNAVREVVQAQWPDKAKRPKNLRLPFRDQGEKEQFDGFEAGEVFVIAKKNEQYGRPGVVNSKNQIVTDYSEVYPGVNARAQVVVYAYTKPDPGVAVGLNHIQLVGGGEPFGNMTRPEDAFEPVAAAGGGDAETADDVFRDDEAGDSVDDILG